MAKLNKHEVKSMLKLHYKYSHSTAELADFFEVSQIQVQKIVKGEAWAEVYYEQLRKYVKQRKLAEVQEKKKQLLYSLCHAIYVGDFQAMKDAVLDLDGIRVSGEKSPSHCPIIGRI